MIKQVARSNSALRGAPIDIRPIEPGAHLIALYHSAAELARIAAAFVGAGLAAGDRVLYLAGDRPLPEARASLEAANTAARPAIAVRQLLLRSVGEVYGKTGCVDVAKAADGFRASALQARAAGFPGLRVAAEMGEFCRGLGSIEQVLAWERMAARLQQESGITSVCQYDKHRLDRSHAELLAALHGGVAPHSTPAPLASLLATPRGLRITGDLDITNRRQLLRTVQARLAACRCLTLDAEEVRFIDMGTLRGLFVLADQAPDRRIVIANAPPQLLRLLAIVGWQHPQLQVEPAGGPAHE